MTSFSWSFSLVVVLGGVSGGKIGVRDVVVGTLLIGIPLIGMTIMDDHYAVQNLIKSAIPLHRTAMNAAPNCASSILRCGRRSALT
jgi:ribose transport system permease protein